MWNWYDQALLDNLIAKGKPGRRGRELSVVLGQDSRVGSAWALLTSSPPGTAGIPAAPLMRRLGGFLLHWQLPGVGELLGG